MTSLSRLCSLSDPAKDDIKNNVIKTFARNSLRTIAIAYKDIEGKYDPTETYSEDLLEQELTLIAIAGIKDPIRPEIPEAVRKCKQAGIRVRMVTGDNLDTAVAIAKECGILDPEFQPAPNSHVVMEGKHFREFVGGLVQAEPGMTEEQRKAYPRVREMSQFEQVAKELCVLARSTPDDKYLLVTGLKQANNVVAVTGDGTNDAPALKKADVGFAMGIAGTEVAREAAAIILLDDNFNSIVTAVKWGRNIYDSIRKFLQFQLTVNIVAVFMAFLGGVILRESPLNPIQMLWVNLIMDTFASLALATEPPTDELLNRQPYGRLEDIVTPMMWRNILGQALFQILILTLILFFGDRIFGVKSSRMIMSAAEKKLLWDAEGMPPFPTIEGEDPEDTHERYEDWVEEMLWNPSDYVHYTMFFHIFVFLQVFNEINCRKLKNTEINVFENFFNNYLFVGVLLFTIVLQMVFVQYGGKAIKCAELNMTQHTICLLIGACSLIIGFIIKKLPEETFGHIKLLKEEAMPLDQVDHSFVAMVRQPSFHRGNTGKRPAQPPPAK
jgi:magnesium-transporting ATPase (P-type)